MKNVKRRQKSKENGVAGLISAVLLLIIAGVFFNLPRFSRELQALSNPDKTKAAIAGIAGTLVFICLLMLMLRVLARSKAKRRAVEAEQAALNRSVNSTWSLTPTDFEDEVAWVFGMLYPFRAERVGRGGDKGVDVKLYDKTTGQLKGIIQAKRYDPSVTLQPGYLRDLAHCKSVFKVDLAYMVTTARVSDQSMQDAKKWGLEVVNGVEFEKYRRRAHEMNAESARSEIKR